MYEGIGTMAYAAPEHKFNKGPYSAKSDMWSVGCILFEMIYGHSAFQGVLKMVREAETNKTEFKLVFP